MKNYFNKDVFLILKEEIDNLIANFNLNDNSRIKHK